MKHAVGQRTLVNDGRVLAQDILHLKAFLFTINNTVLQYTEVKFYMCVCVCVLGSFENCEKRIVASSRLSVHPPPPPHPSIRHSVCTEQLGSRWTDFHKIWYLSILRESVEKVQVTLISDRNNNGCFTWSLTYIFASTSLNSSWNEKYFRQNYRENRNTHFMFNN